MFRHGVAVRNHRRWPEIGRLIQHGAIRLAPPSAHPAIAHPPEHLPADPFRLPAGSRRQWERILIEACEKTFRMTAIIAPFTDDELAAIEVGIGGYKNIAGGEDLIKQPADANSLDYGDNGGSKGQKTS
jgi:hypothetical protein